MCDIVIQLEMSSSRGIFLDVDSSIVEKNLKITNDPAEEEFSKLFPLAEQCPSKVIKPFPGFCIKTKEVGTGTKFFVNVCTTDAIPAPKDISEKDLECIIETEDGEAFKVPMSIGDVRNDKDNKGEDVKVCDIAINPTFFKKIEAIELFKSFFLAIVFQGIQNKHNIVCVEEKIILRNKKAFGNLQLHRIQQREIDEKMKSTDRNISLMEEVTGRTEASQPKPLIETITTIDNPIRTPEYRLFKKKNEQKNCLFGEFKFPDIISSKELTLDIGEDRILLESKNRGYLVDVFVPYIIRQDNCSSSFDKATKVLTVKMPLVGG